MNKAIHDYLNRKEKKEDLARLVPFLVCFKYPKNLAGTYARKKISNEYKNRLKEGLANELQHIYTMLALPGTEEALHSQENLAELYSQQKDYQSTLKEYRIFILQNPGHPRLKTFQLRIADCLYQLKEYGKALSSYRRFIEQYPEDESAPACLEKTAWILHKQKKFEEAFSVCQQMKGKYPLYQTNNPELNKFISEEKKKIACQIVLLREKINKFSGKEEGLKSLDRLSSLLKDNEQEANRIYKDIILRHPDSKTAIEAQLLQIDILIKKRNFDQAIDKANYLIEKHADSNYILLAREKIADCLYAQAKYMPALKEYKKLALSCLKQDNIKRESIIQLGVHKAYEEYSIKELQAEIKYFKGSLLMTRAKANDAANVFQESLLLYQDLPEDLSVKKSISGLCLDLVDAYYQAGNYEKAVKSGLDVFKDLASRHKDHPGFKEYNKNLILAFQAVKNGTNFLDRCSRVMSKRQNRSLKGDSIYAPLTKLTRINPTLNPKERYLLQILLESVLQYGGQQISDKALELLSKYPQHELKSEVMSSIITYISLVRRHQKLEISMGTLLQGLKEIQLQEDFFDQCLNLKEYAPVVQFYKNVVKTSSDKKTISKTLADLIGLYQNMKKYDEAIETCQKIIRDYPQSQQTSETHRSLGKLYYLRRDYTLALSEFEQYLANKPNKKQLIEVNLLTALCYFHTQEHQKAIKKLRKVISKSSDEDTTAKARFLLAWCYLSQQDYKQAEKEYKRVISKYPNTKYVKKSKEMVERIKKIVRNRR